MGKLRAIFRFVGFIAVLSFYVIRYLLISILRGGLDINRALRHRQALMTDLCRITGIRVERQGHPPAEPVLLVSNHRSYIDPVTVLEDVIAWPVTKSEVAGWPIVGYGLKISGVLFVERSNKNSRRSTRQLMAQLISEGHSILIYPEGTTHIRHRTIDFKKGSFIRAAQAAIPIVPVAIEFKNESDAWVGDDTFIRHFLECFAKPYTDVRLRYGPVIRSTDPEVLLTKAKIWIDQNLSDMQREWRES